MPRSMRMTLHKMWRVGRGRVARTVLACLFFVAVPAFALKSVWCGKLPGLLERNYTFEESHASISFAESLGREQNKSILYLRSTSRDNQVRAGAAATVPLAFEVSGDAKKASEMTTDQVEAYAKSPELQPSLKQLIETFKTSKPEPNWYFYSDSPAFTEYFREARFKLEKPERGAVLLMDEEGERAYLNAEVVRMSKYLQVGLIVVESDHPVRIDFPKTDQSRPLILRLKAEAKPNVALSHSFHASDPLEELLRKPITLGLPPPTPPPSSEEQSKEAMPIPEELHTQVSSVLKLQNANPSNTTIVFLMPSKIADATSWGFPDELAERYVTNGQRVLRDLTAYGYQKSVVMTRDKASALSAVAAASHSRDSVTVIIGEAGKDGGVRIPGSTDLLGSADLSSSIGDSSLLGLVCDSEKLATDAPGLSIIGTIFTDQLRAIARVILDKRPPDSTEEYLDIPYSAPSKTPSGIALSTLHVVSSAAGHLAVESKGQSHIPVLYAVSAISTPPSTSASSTPSSAWPGPAIIPEPNPSPDPPLFPLFLSGIIGALGREVLRWRRLANAKRASLFGKPRYFAISSVQVLLGGAVAIIFGRMLSDPWAYVIGFVCGAGLEELVRRAMKLKVWTPPVPHGPDEESRDSVLEYLRS